MFLTLHVWPPPHAAANAGPGAKAGGTSSSASTSKSASKGASASAGASSSAAPSNRQAASDSDSDRSKKGASAAKQQGKASGGKCSGVSPQALALNVEPKYRKYEEVVTKFSQEGVCRPGISLTKEQVRLPFCFPGTHPAYMLLELRPLDRYTHGWFELVSGVVLYHSLSLE
jgi:hypothetical protein